MFFPQIVDFTVIKQVFNVWRISKETQQNNDPVPSIKKVLFISQFMR